MFSLLKYGEDQHSDMPLDEEVHEMEKQVMDMLLETQLIHVDRLQNEVSWFFRHLGLDPFYFRSNKPKTIAKHITALYAAKMLATTTSDKSLALRLQQEKESGARYIVPSVPNIHEKNPSEDLEYRIEREYLCEGYDPAETDLCVGKYRVQVYRTSGTISSTSQTKLRMFFVEKSVFNEENVPLGDPIDLKRIADKHFFATASDHSKNVISEVLVECQKQLGPVIRVVEVENAPVNQEVRLVVGFRQGSTHSFFSGLTALYHYHNLHSKRKYIEQFSNGLSTYSLYLFLGKEISGDVEALKKIVNHVANDASLIYVLPRTSLFSLFQSGEMSLAEVTYAYAIWKFAHQFFTLIGDEEFSNISAQANVQAQGIISKVKAGLKREVMTEGRVKECIYAYASIVRDLYADFKRRFYIGAQQDAITEEEITNKIKRAAKSDLDMKILNCMMLFNQHVLKTNFFKESKVALSFRLDSAFLKSSDFPNVPYAIFFVVGAEFRGFHVRFVEIARGGIRVIRSANEAAFSMNVATLFEENYNLAHTQQRKNKDIPEGGSKGTILLSRKHQDKALVAFKKYVDALLDLLLPSSEVVDKWGKEELLFLGPDEGTADFMNWASQHARERGYPFWKSFTTGKSRELGGIPHDLYGMTTHSIHQFVLGILRKKELEESSIRKFQTGGPDGDLGSNEIKISQDKTIAIVDGSGVLYDPEGIDREELLRLANGRMMSEHFDKSKLSSNGFFVHLQDQDKKLPDGTIVESGMMFRNAFHLKTEYLSGIELFVPCGGRPAAVNINNVHHLFDTNKQPIFKYIVEGANLFFTQDARLELEHAGVILFKDASANKGGVTSSSLEVLAALALSDEEFHEHMQVKNKEVPAFYNEYVQDVIEIIDEHAREEFECLWNESQKCNTPLCILSDLLSEKINKLNDDIVNSSLWSNHSLRLKVIQSAIPPSLVKMLGIDTIMQRVPDSYLKAIFAAHLACKFIYTRGLNAGEFGFFEFMQEYMQ